MQGHHAYLRQVLFCLREEAQVTALCFQTVLLIGPISSMNRESNFCEKPRLRERQKERETERERGRDVPGGM
jgi:hypothetical protein